MLVNNNSSQMPIFFVINESFNFNNNLHVSKMIHALHTQEIGTSHECYILFITFQTTTKSAQSPKIAHYQKLKTTPTHKIGHIL